MERNGKTYRVVNLYVDESDPEQKELLRILNMIPRKKTQFLSLLIKEFENSFEEGTEFSSEKLKAYMKLNSSGFQIKVKKEKPKAATVVKENAAVDADIGKPQDNKISTDAYNAARKLMSGFMV